MWEDEKSSRNQLAKCHFKNIESDANVTKSSTYLIKFELTFNFKFPVSIFGNFPNLKKKKNSFATCLSVVQQNFILLSAKFNLLICYKMLVSFQFALSKEILFQFPLQPTRNHLILLVGIIRKAKCKKIAYEILEQSVEIL